MKKLSRPNTSIDHFVAEVAKTKQPPKNANRLIFALDATGSRQPTWDLATHLHAELFLATDSNAISVQLAYFQGYNEFKTTGWQSSAEPLLRAMQHVHCKAGLTQIRRVLKHVHKEASNTQLKAAVYIGDSCEEDPSTLYEYAGTLGILKVPLFVFQEGFDPNAQAIFSQLARRSGGVHAPFNAGSAKELRDLLGAVATYTSGGRNAVKRLDSQAATLLLRQLKK